MEFYVDAIRMQNPTHFFKEFKLIAEMGITVIIVSDDSYAKVEPGYYYVSIYREFLKNADFISHYTVSRESIYDYFYGYTPKDNIPEIVEQYDQIEDAIQSEFLDFFLKLDKLIEESRNNTVNNTSKFTAKNKSFKGEISIISAENYTINTSCILSNDENPIYEICLFVDSNQGYNIGGNILPYMHYEVHIGDKIKEFPNLRFIGNEPYFLGCYELEQFTLSKVKEYIKKNNIESDFTKEDFQSLKMSLLHRCLGEKI